MSERAIVVGAGVSGLSSALALSEAGYGVEIVTDRPTERTTSAVAGACWYPFHVGAYEPGWAERTYEWFVDLAGDPASGVTIATCREYFENPLTDEQIERDFWWRGLTGIDFQILPPAAARGENSCAAILQFTVPVIRMPDYLRWLTDRLTARGVEIHQRVVKRFDDLFDAGRVVVNCTALGSRELCGDESVFPAQGQVVVVKNWGLTEMSFGTGDEAWPIYLIPRGTDVVLGGTFRPGVWSEEADEVDAREIRARCAELDPRAAGAEVVGTRTGLRPCRRTGPRVEAERCEGGLVVHNYGHSGGGVTLSWGCAEEVVRLVQAHRFGIW
jgi:D-amino-acid oxidase